MRVTHTIKSPGNDPVTYNYTTSQADAVTTIAAVAQILSTDYSEIPENFRPETLAIHIEL